MENLLSWWSSRFLLTLKKEIKTLKIEILFKKYTNKLFERIFSKRFILQSWFKIAWNSSLKIIFEGKLCCRIVNWVYLMTKVPKSVCIPWSCSLSECTVTRVVLSASSSSSFFASSAHGSHSKQHMLQQRRPILWQSSYLLFIFGIERALSGNDGCYLMCFLSNK